MTNETKSSSETLSEPSTSDSLESSPPTYRLATLHDVVPIARLLREFYHREGDIYGISYDHESTVATVDEVVNHGICLVGPTSCAGALIRPFPYNHQAHIALIPFWYFRNRREIGIFQVLLKACVAAGATHINVASHYPHNIIGRFYRKCGIQPVEVQYLAAIR